MPQTLEVMAKLHKFAPTNVKIRSYIVKCYIQYGYPEKALSYFTTNKDSFDQRAMFSILGDLYSAALKGEDEKVVTFLLEEYVKVYLAEGHSPNYASSLMSQKARYVQFITNKKKDPKRAIEVAEADLKWFELQTVKEKQSKYWEKANMRDVEGYKQYIFEIYFPSAKYKHLFYMSQAMLQLKDNAVKIPEIIAICETMEKAEIKFSSSYYRFYQIYYGYNYVSQLYNLLGDKENGKKYSVMSQDFRKKYSAEATRIRKERAEARAKAQEAAKKKAAEEAAKKAAEEEGNKE